MKPRDPIEVSVKVHNPGCPIMEAMKQSGLNFETKEISVGEEKTKHLVKIENFDDNLSYNLRKESITASRINKNMVWLECPSCQACRTIAISRALVVSSFPTRNDTVTYKLMLPSKNSLKELRELLESSTLAIEMEEEFLYRLPKELTKRQIEILLIAFRKGYFDIDRKISLTELSKELGVNPTSLRDSLRRGLRKIIQYYILNELQK